MEIQLTTSLLHNLLSMGYTHCLPKPDYKEKHALTLLPFRYNSDLEPLLTRCNGYFNLEAAQFQVVKGLAATTILVDISAVGRRYPMMIAEYFTEA